VGYRHASETEPDTKTEGDMVSQLSSDEIHEELGEGSIADRKI